jgi:hypothetical protein
MSQWNLVSYDSSYGEMRFTLIRNLKDTVYWLSFSKQLPDTIFNFDDSYYLINYYIKEYADDNYRHHLRMANDTQYYYKKPLNNLDSLIFIKGKYQYLFNKGKLSSNQLDYFMLNKDSLRKVKGDSLPELPMR